MQHIRIKLITILITVLGFLPGIPELRGQEVPELFIAVEDTDVHIYHLELLSPGHGFNIYRRVAGERDYVRLNETVVRGARRGSELHPFWATGTRKSAGNSINPMPQPCFRC